MATRKRNPEKIRKILEKRGYPDGELPKGKVAHHIKPIAEGGKDTSKNIRVISEAKHKQIHKNRRKQGRV